jgi:hypothetical protein
MKRYAIVAVVAVLLGWSGARAWSQPSEPPPAAADPSLRTHAELDLMLTSIALYPDPLLVELLTSATQPAEIVMADRFAQSGKDLHLLDAHLWDGSVKAMVHYPDVLKWMDDNLTWTAAVGEAFAAQPADVMESVQGLRARARDLGNLQTTAEQEVISDDGMIEIVPTDADTLYIPAYDPALAYDNPPPPDGTWVVFGAGFPIGNWMARDFDWRRHHVFIWPRSHPRPPGWWHRPPDYRRNSPFGEHGALVWTARPRRDAVSVGRTEVLGRQDRGWDARAGDAGNPGQFGVVPRPAGHPADATVFGVQGAGEARSFSVRGSESRSFSPPAGGGAGRGRGGGGGSVTRSGGGNRNENSGGGGGKSK